MPKVNDPNSVFTYLPSFEVCGSCGKPILPNTKVHIQGNALVSDKTHNELPLHKLSLDEVIHQDCPTDAECDTFHRLAAALGFIPEVQRFWRDHYLDSTDEELLEAVADVGDGWGLDTARKDLAHEVDAYVGFYLTKVMRIFNQRRREMFTQEVSTLKEEGS